MEAILRHLCQIHDLTAVAVQFNAAVEPQYGITVYAHFEPDGCEMGCAGNVDDALTVALRKVKNERDNAAEATWQRHQEALMESGEPDDSAYHRDMKAAGRGHLLGA